ncbi:MAG: response regulator, partial [Oligoflexales bacterium]|nr:response regulator [Oligoflexales bacterium]
ISQEEALNLFQPFVQANSSITRKFGGTGLGLILSRRLAEILGGNVVLKNSKKGEGSLFEITLSLKKVNCRADPGDYRNERSIQQNKKIVDENPLRGIHLLVVEDMEENQILMERTLKMVGVILDMASDGEEAIRKALSNDYDIVLMDIQMPRMDGYTAVKNLREKGYNRPIIAITAYAMKEDMEKSLAAGCDAHLAKPVDRRKMMSTFEEMIFKYGRVNRRSGSSKQKS